jgi:hypothetical protein
MSAATSRPTFEEIDAALDDVQQVREQVLAQSASVERCVRLADLAAVEASWWAALNEHCRARPYWRAALTAREHALDTARAWRARAQVLETAESADLQTAPTEAA